MRVEVRKFLSVWLLLLIATLAVNGATSIDTAVVKDVSVSANGESLEFKIAASQDSKFTYFELQSPHRLVIDFHGNQNNIGFKEKRIDSAGVERVRTSFFSDQTRKATRIVFDLAEKTPYRVLEDGGGIVRIVFGETARAPWNLTAGPAMIPEPSTKSVAKLPAVMLSSSLLQNEPAFPIPQPLAQTVVETSQNTGASTALAAPAPVATASPILAAAPQQTAPVAQQTQITIVPPTPPQVQATTPTPTPQYNGEIISLDLRDYDVKDFFRLMSEISGLNVVLDPNVVGTVTLKLTDVPWDQALDVILKNYQLGGQLQGNVLRIATNATLQSEEQGRKALRDAQDLAAALDTRTFVLNYTKADIVSGTLQRLLSSRGTIIQDARRNALIVSDIPSQFLKIGDMIKFLDTPAQQVEIEARLLSANKSFSRELGNQLGLLLGNRTGNILTGVPGNSSPFQRVPPPRVTNGNGIPLVANFPAPATSGLSFLIQSGGDFILDEIITAAEAHGTAKLISRPRVTTQNNQVATISQGTQIPVQTNVNNTISVQFLRFSLQLQVTPQITEAGTILLTVDVENSQPDFARAVNGVPSVATQKAQTQVLIPDGGTAVIGGILVDNDSVNVRQVPGLGSLPLIGTLFKNTSTIKSTAELIFFITPRIKNPDSITVLAPGDGPPPAEQVR
jgi:type IV pilus assembly protein PilQ